MALRRAIFWIHLAVGVAAAIVVFMMAATGVILTYEAQFNRWALRGYLAEPSPVGVAPLALDDLVAQVSARSPGVRVSSIAVTKDPLEPAVVRIDRANEYVSRFTGEKVGDGNTQTRRFLRSVMYWHRWFALEGDYRIIGRTFTATANLGFLFLLVSGCYLWWPSTKSRAAWRQVLWFRRGLTGRARNFNWHSVIGFWSAVPLAIIIASGASISYQWAGDFVYWLASDTPPSQASSAPSQSAASEPESARSDPAAPLVDLETLAAKAVAETPEWRTIRLSLPQSVREPVSIMVDRGTGRQPSKTEQLLFDRSTGDLVERSGYPTYSPGLKVRRWLRFAHTGEVYGVIGQSIAGVVSLGVAVMVWTGLAMCWRRFFGPLRRG